MSHTCDRTCRCPSCGRPLLYNRRTETHGCPDHACENARPIYPRKQGHW